jgi:hypothetical protein
MKSSILTIILTALVATSPLCAQQSLFDTLFDTMKQYPKTTLFCAFAGYIASYQFGYSNCSKKLQFYGKEQYDLGYENGFKADPEKAKILVKQADKAMKLLDREGGVRDTFREKARGAVDRLLN